MNFLVIKQRSDVVPYDGLGMTLNNVIFFTHDLLHLNAMQ